jgi:hypothetical protein
MPSLLLYITPTGKKNRGAERLRDLHTPAHTQPYNTYVTATSLTGLLNCVFIA